MAEVKLKVPAAEVPVGLIDLCVQQLRVAFMRQQLPEVVDEFAFTPCEKVTLQLLRETAYGRDRLHDIE